MNNPRPISFNMLSPSQSGAAGSGNAEQAWGHAATPYEALGGEDAVRRLVESFYDRMETQAPQVRALHPPDLASSREKLFQFLSGWLGGPQLYMQTHGHPRLRMRHAPFPIDQAGVDAWLGCMMAAMDDCQVTDPLRSFLQARFQHTANFLRNR